MMIYSEAACKRYGSLRLPTDILASGANVKLSVTRLIILPARYIYVH